MPPQMPLPLYSPMRQELLRRRAANSLSSNPHLLPMSAPHPPIQAPVPVIPTSSPHPPPVHPPQTTTGQDNNGHTQPAETPRQRPIPKAQSIPMSGLASAPPARPPAAPKQSPMQQHLLRERRRRMAPTSTSPTPSKCQTSQIPPLPPSTSAILHPSQPPTPRQPLTRDASTHLPQRTPTRHPSRSPAMTTFTPPPTTSYGTPLTRRKVLLVGIGYRNHRFLRPLPGCRTDVRNMFSLLTGPLFSFPTQNVRVLCDELSELGGVRVSMPTRVNILRHLRWLTSDVEPGDSVLFFFAGHGDFVEDLSGDEVDSGVDQCIMPMDYEVMPTHGAGKLPRGAPAILDDTIYERLVRTVPEGAKVTAIVDACRSGTVCDLPVQYGGDGHAQFRNGGRGPPREVRRPYLAAGGCVLFSGSADSQMSADMVVPSPYGPEFPDEHCGIMTRSFIDAVEEMCAVREGAYDGVEEWTYGILMQRLRELVKERARRVVPEYMEEQEPQLSASHPIDIWATPFTL